MNKIKQVMLKNEYVFSIITKLCMVVTGLIYSIFFARYVGAEIKGSISYIQSVIGIGSIVLSFGMHQAYPYYRKNNKGNPLFLSTYMSSIISLFLIFMSIGIICFFVTKNNIAIACSVLLMPIWGYTRISGYVMLVESPNKRNFSILFFSFIEMVYAIILYLFAPKTFLLGLSAIVLVEILKVIYFTIKIQFTFSFKYISLKLIKELFSYGFFPMIALLMTTLNYRIDVLMLKNSATITLAGVGIYSIGSALAEKALLIPDAVKEILLSKLAKGKTEKEVAVVSRMAFFVAIIVAICIVILGKPFLDYMYGEEYNGAYVVTAISVFGTIFMVFFKMIGQYNIVNKKQKLNVYFLSISVATNYLLNALLIPRYGINGAAIATVVSHIICAVVYILYFSKIANISIFKIMFLQKEDLRVMKRMLFERKGND